MNLYEEIEKIKASGYSEQNAQSKLGQDIILKAIADSGNDIRVAEKIIFLRAAFRGEISLERIAVCFCASTLIAEHVFDSSKK